MHDPPPSVYESWPALNPIDPATRGNGLTLSNAIFMVVVVAVVGARCYTRLKITGSWGVDDMFIVASLIPALGQMSCTIVADSLYDWNKHMWDLPAENIHNGLQLEFAALLLYVWSSVLTKISVVMFCRRLLSPSHPEWYRGGLLWFAALILFGNVVYTVVFLSSCQPLSAYFDFTPPTWRPDYLYTCISIPTAWSSGSILNCVCDFLTWLVPLPIVYQLRLPLRQRIAVMALFAIGICVIIASIMKTIYIYLAFVYSYDEIWVGWPIWICGALEIALGIICASAPALRPFFSHFFPSPAEVFANRHSYARMSRGRDGPGPLDQMGMEMVVSPLPPVHQHLESVGSVDDMKPWAYNNSRGSSRAQSRRGSLSKIETNLNTSKPSSLNTTPATLTPGSPASKRLTPVRELDPISGVFNEDFKFNQTAALPPPNEDDEGPLSGGRLPVSPPDKAASPTWWRARSRAGSSPMKATFERERKGSTSTVGSVRDRKGSFNTTDLPELRRNTSIKSDHSRRTPTPKPGSPLKANLKLDTEMDRALAGSPAGDTPTSATSRSARRHSRKPSLPQEFETFNFGLNATNDGRDNTAPQATVNDLPPPPSYGEFVENNSWIRDDRTTGRRSIEDQSQQHSHAK